LVHDIALHPHGDRAKSQVRKQGSKLLSEIWRIKGLAEQEYGPQHPITKKLASMHEDAQKLLHRHSPSHIPRYSDLDSPGARHAAAALHSPGALSKILDICVTLQDLEEMVL
jgi:hypothetical protein